jgi:hypothetical protein
MCETFSLTTDNILAYLGTEHFFEKQLQLRRKTLHVFHSSLGLLMYFSPNANQ